MSVTASGQLTHDQEEEAIDMVLNLAKQEDIARAMGFKHRKEYQRYLINHPEFYSRIQAAILATCDYLEDDLLSVAEDYRDDAKLARVKLEAISRILKFRNPKKYGDKTQIELTATVDVAAALSRAEGRIVEELGTNLAIAHINTPKLPKN